MSGLPEAEMHPASPAVTDADVSAADPGAAPEVCPVEGPVNEAKGDAATHDMADEAVNASVDVVADDAAAVVVDTEAVAATEETAAAAEVTVDVSALELHDPSDVAPPAGAAEADVVPNTTMEMDEQSTVTVTPMDDADAGVCASPSDAADKPMDQVPPLPDEGDSNSAAVDGNDSSAIFRNWKYFVTGTVKEEVVTLFGCLA
jgi:hypothetical protein